MKAQLRSQALKRRATISPLELSQAGDALVATQRRFIDDLQPGSAIAAYVSMGHEIPTPPLLDSLLKQGMRVLVPRLGTGLDIGWSDYTGTLNLVSMPNTASRKTRPQEPQGKRSGPDAIRQADIIMVPALAVDPNGTRLGRGAGWYDRALQLKEPRAKVIGICWPWEITDSPLPAESHDIPVDYVLQIDMTTGMNTRILTR